MSDHPQQQHPTQQPVQTQQPAPSQQTVQAQQPSPSPQPDPAPKNEPAARHYDGRLKAAVWKNPGERGPIYNATLSYSYQDKDGAWRDTNSIPGHELLRAGRLLEKSYDSVRELKDRDRALYVEQQQQAQRGAPDRSRGPSR